VTRRHPAARVLLLYAACLAAALVAAVTIASLRNAPPADAGADTAGKAATQPRGAPTP
jgi:hypothetical protein